MIPALDTNADLPVASVAYAARLSDEARACGGPDLNVRRYLDRLLEGGLQSDAVDLLAQVLPRRYAVAWALECLQSNPPTGAGPDPIEHSALAATQRWLKDPTEENRRAAAELADRLRYETAGAWLAAAAGWSGGSLLPPDQAEVKPDPGLTGEAVSAALKLAAASMPDEYDARLLAYARRALATFASPDAGTQS